MALIRNEGEGRGREGEEAAHLSVLLHEVIEAAETKEGDCWVDGTFGRGGHTRALLERGAKVLALDCDKEAGKAAEILSKAFPGKLTWKQGNFRDLEKWSNEEKLSGLSGVLLDLGVSSPQIEKAERGFSFRLNGPLDMRMDAGKTKTAAHLVAEWDQAQLEHIFYEYGDEKQGRRIARSIVEQREREPITTTQQLAELVERVVGGGRGRGIHPATRVFQALRMAVNEEREALMSVLPQATKLLKPGGKLAVISFHSGEDKIVKGYMKKHAMAAIHDPKSPFDRPNVLHFFEKTKRYLPSVEEVTVNPRSRSAVLRVAIRNEKPFVSGE